MPSSLEPSSLEPSSLEPSSSSSFSFFGSKRVWSNNVKCETATEQTVGFDSNLDEASFYYVSSVRSIDMNISIYVEKNIYVENAVALSNPM